MSSLLETNDVCGCIAPYSAIECNRWEVFDYFCSRGLSISAKDSPQLTLLHYAAWTGQAESMDILRISNQDLSGLDHAELDSLKQMVNEYYTDLREHVYSNIRSLHASGSRSTP